jgi:hypothetical protein
LISFAPKPETLRALGIQKDEDIFVAEVGNILMDDSPFDRGGNLIAGDNLINGDPGKLGDGSSGVCDVLVARGSGLDGLAIPRLGPAKNLDKEGREVECLKQIAGACGIECHKGMRG